MIREGGEEEPHRMYFEKGGEVYAAVADGELISAGWRVEGVVRLPGGGRA